MMLSVLPRTNNTFGLYTDTYTGSHDIEISHPELDTSERSLLESQHSDTEPEDGFHSPQRPEDSYHHYRHHNQTHSEYASAASSLQDPEPAPFHSPASDSDTHSASNNTAQMQSALSSLHSFVPSIPDASAIELQPISKRGAGRIQAEKQHGSHHNHSNPSHHLSSLHHPSLSMEQHHRNRPEKTPKEPKVAKEPIVPHYSKPYYYIPAEAEREFCLLDEARARSYSGRKELKGLSKTGSAGPLNNPSKPIPINPRGKPGESSFNSSAAPMSVSPPVQKERNKNGSYCAKCGAPIPTSRGYCRTCIVDDDNDSGSDTECCHCSIA